MMSSLHLPLAALPAHPTLGESLMFQLNGLIVVFIALCSIWGLVEFTGFFFRRSQANVVKRAAVVTPAAKPAPVATAPEADPGPSPEIIAVIAAAVAVTVGTRHRLLAITPVTPTGDWAREGRRNIFATRNPR